MSITLDDIKREAFRRSNVSTSVSEKRASALGVEKLAERLESNSYVETSSDDGLLYEYEQMLKKAQANAAERLGLVDGHLTLR